MYVACIQIQKCEKNCYIMIVIFSVCHIQVAITRSLGTCVYVTEGSEATTRSDTRSAQDTKAWEPLHEAVWHSPLSWHSEIFVYVIIIWKRAFPSFGHGDCFKRTIQTNVFGLKRTLYHFVQALLWVISNISKRFVLKFLVTIVWIVSIYNSNLVHNNGTLISGVMCQSAQLMD